MRSQVLGVAFRARGRMRNREVRMALHKQEQPERGFDYERAYRELSAKMRTLHISRIAEMPRIELYRDQLISIVQTELAPLYGPDEKIVTGSMVNNYVKQHVMPAPTRKRYTRRHLASLLFVCTFKRVLPIAQVTLLYELCRDAEVDFARAYDQLADALEQTLAARFGATATSADVLSAPIALVNLRGEPVTGTLPSLLQNAISLIANKVYIEQMLSLEAKRERSVTSE